MRAPARVDIIDETFVDAPATVVAAILKDPRNLQMWWPYVTLDLVDDRGDLGAVWRVSGGLEGEFEIWVEPWWDGVLVHHFVRASTPPGGRRRAKEVHVTRWKKAITRVKDLVEPPRRQWRLTGGESVWSRGEM